MLKIILLAEFLCRLPDNRSLTQLRMTIMDNRNNTNLNNRNLNGKDGSSNKWLVILGLIVLVAIIAFVLQSNRNPNDTTNAATNQAPVSSSTTPAVNNGAMTGPSSTNTTGTAPSDTTGNTAGAPSSSTPSDATTPSTTTPTTQQ